MSQTQAFWITVKPLAYNVKTIFSISLSRCLSQTQSWSSQEVMVSGHAYCVTQFGTEKKKGAVRLSGVPSLHPIKSINENQKGWQDKWEKQEWNFAKLKAIWWFYRDMCVLIMILLARLQYGTLGWYDAYRWGSAERRWSCEHNWVFHTPPSKFTPSLSLSLSLSLWG